MLFHALIIELFYLAGFEAGKGDLARSSHRFQGAKATPVASDVGPVMKKSVAPAHKRPVKNP